MEGLVIFRWWEVIVGRCRGSRLRSGRCWRRRVGLGVMGLWEQLVRQELQVLRVWRVLLGCRGLRLVLVVGG